MKRSLYAVVIGAMLMASNAMAAYQKLAECSGQTDNRQSARAVLFVDAVNDSLGIVTVSLQNGLDYVSTTKVNWRANPQGYPRFFDNDFDLDIVINDSAPSSDDILVDKNYVRALRCVYMTQQ